VDVGALGAPAHVFAFSTLSKYPSPNLSAMDSRCLLSVLPNVIEEAVWMLGVAVG
jgi:hypothetical protein